MMCVCRFLPAKYRGVHSQRHLSSGATCLPPARPTPAREPQPHSNHGGRPATSYYYASTYDIMSHECPTF